MTEPTTNINPPEWRDVASAGGIDAWVLEELRRLNLRDESTDPSSLSDKEKKAFKVRREEERRVRKLLFKAAWVSYKRAHIIHVGAGVFYHDTPDVDRRDVDDPATRRKDNDLPEIPDAQALAKALGMDIPKLRWFAFHRDVDTGTHYRRWMIAKRDGGQRLISAPKKDLKAAQRWIARNITEHLPVHGAAHGFLPGRSTRTNALPHAGARVVVKIDVKDFYPTVTMPRVKGLLRKAGYGEQVATLLALLCTEAPRTELQIEGKTYWVAIGPRSLPQGVPTSPSITNTLCRRIDARLTGIAAKLGFEYTRYADDLTFSCREKTGSKIGKLLHRARKILSEEGFKVHPDKTRIMRSGRRQKVTGLVVNDAPADAPRARVPRKLVRQLRAAIFNRKRGKEGKGETLAHLRGLAAYVHMADRERGRAFLDEIDALEGGGK